MGFTNPYPASRLTVDSTNSLATGLAAWFPLTDGSGTTIDCIVHAGHTATQSGGVSWASTDIGTAASFDGVDDYFDLGTSFWNDNIAGGYDFSINAWFYVDSTSSDSCITGSWGPESNLIMWVDVGGSSVSLTCIGTNFGFPITSTSAPTVSTGNWHMATLVADNTAGTATVYLNGVSSNSVSYTASLGTITNPFGLGSDRGDSAVRQMSGDIQNIRFYSRTLSAAEVATLYHRPWEGSNYGDIWPYSPPAAGSMTLSTDTAATSLNSGCVHWWPLTGDAADVTTTADNLTATGTPTWVSSEIGTGVELVSNTTYLTSSVYGNTYQVNTPITISAWVKFNTSTLDNGLLQYADADTNGTPLYLLQQYGANLRWYAKGAYSSSMSAAVGEWHHVALTNNGTSIDCYLNGAYENTLSGSSLAGEDANNKFWIGAGYQFNNTNQFQNVRIWDRALSAEEISILHDRPWEGIEYGDTFHYDPPAPASMLPLTSDAINTDQVGWWPLTETDDYASGAADISGSGNNGTQSGGVLSEVSRLGGVASFDGVDDEILIGSVDDTTYSMSSFTTSLWFELDPTYTPSQYDFIVGFCNSSGYGWRFWTQDGTSRLLSFSLRDPTTNTHVETTQTLSELGLFHATGTWDGTNHRLYVNGVEVASTTRGIDPGASNKYFLMGAMISGSPPVRYRHIKGKLSNVRTWNRALTADEVWSIYTNPWLGSNYKLASGSSSTPLYNYIFRTERFRRLG